MVSAFIYLFICSAIINLYSLFYLFKIEEKKRAAAESPVTTQTFCPTDTVQMVTPLRFSLYLAEYRRINCIKETFPTR